MPFTRVTLAGTAAGLALIAGAVMAQPSPKAEERAEHGAAKSAPKKAAGKPAGKPREAANKPQNKSPARPAMVSPVHAGDQQRQTAERKPQKAVDRQAQGEGKTKVKVRTVAAPQRTPRADVKRSSYPGPKGGKVVVPTNDRVRVITRKRAVDWTGIDRRPSYTGCPPGLAKKYNGCTPPGLSQPPGRTWKQPSWYWRTYNRDYRYRYADGYMLRLGTGTRVLGYIPLLAGALAIGETWPLPYKSMALPDYYDSYYGLGRRNAYRYYDDTIYRVDPDTKAIQSVAALLTGDDIVVGRPMPPGYEVYNVPYAYRDQYYDTPDAMYRYSDGYLYQLDPTTRLVQAAIELLG